MRKFSTFSFSMSFSTSYVRCLFIQETQSCLAEAWSKCLEQVKEVLRVVRYSFIKYWDCIGKIVRENTETAWVQV